MVNLTNDYYYFTEALDKKTCDKIIKAGIEDFDEAVVGNPGEEVLDKKIRRSKVTWVSEQWIYDLIWPYMQEANEQAGWKYDIRGAEPVQLGKYEKGAFYNFHQDGRSDNLSAYNTPDNKIKHGNVRKLSMSIHLNDDYEEGGFQFATGRSEGRGNPSDKEAFNIYTPTFHKLGSVIVFPSFMVHRVQPVTKGTRYSLVSWFVGPPFK